jgi:uncharacterized protein (TIGR02391 family)
MPIRWDNIQILQAIDRRQQQHGGGPVQGMSGLHLMEDVAGSQVTDPPLWRGFVQELHIARRIGLLTFTETYKGNPNADPGRNPHFYLQTIWDFALTVPGQDRARGRVVVQPPSDPAEDNGNLISDLILQQIAEAIDHQYSEEQAVTFLMEAGALIPDLPQSPDEAGHAIEVLRALNDWGSEGRRILRSFLSRLLDDQLILSLDDDLRTSLVEQLARQGWYVKDGNLVSGEPARGKRTSSPVLRDARLAALHPAIEQAAGKLLKDGHRAAAVFEAAKALNNRVKNMVDLTSDGVGLMSAAFSTTSAHLVLADLTTTTGRDIQDGYRFLFMGAQAAIRNPRAHEPFTDMSEEDALELLALTSHLMRQLDHATPAPAGRDS